MRSRFIIILTLILLTGQQLSAQSSKESAYTLVRQDERVTLYERWADFPGTTIKARDLKIIFNASTTPEKMRVLITNEKSLKEWQKNLLEYKIIPKNDTVWQVYSFYKMPWPLTDQDYFANYSVAHNSANKIIIVFEPAENKHLAPVKEKVDRMKAYGKWTIEKKNANTIKVTYTITGNPVSIPRAVTDNIVRNNFMNTINSLIDVAEK